MNKPFNTFVHLLISYFMFYNLLSFIFLSLKFCYHVLVWISLKFLVFRIKTPPKSPARLVWKFIVSYFLKFLSHQLILFPTIPLSAGHNLPGISGRLNTTVVTVSCVKRI